MRTILDLIRSAARKGNIIASGEELTSSQAQDALESLNFLLDGWALMRLTVYKLVNIDIPISAGMGVYTIGATGSVVVELPARIESYADFTIGGVKSRALVKRDIELPVANVFPFNPLYVSNTLQQYNDLITYSVSADLWTFTVNNILGATSLRIYSESLPKNLTLTDSLNLPQGYEFALITNLANLLITEYGMAVTQDMQTQAQTALRTLQRHNSQPIRTNGDTTLLGMSRGSYHG